MPKRANTDFEFGWKEETQLVQKPSFSILPGINKNFHITSYMENFIFSFLVLLCKLQGLG